MKDVQKKKKLLRERTYKKSNELINAKGRTTLLCLKLFAIGMQNIRLDEHNHVVAKIYSSELKLLFDAKGGSFYTHIAEACEKSSSRSTLFDWSILTKDSENEYLRYVQVITDATFEDGVLTMRYNDLLTDILYGIKNDYTLLSLSETMMFKSIYSLRLYELLKSAYTKDESFNKTNDTRIYEFHVLDLKFRLGILVANEKKIREELKKENPDYQMIQQYVDETNQSKWSDFRIFNRDVIKKSLKEINQKGDYNIEYEGKKGEKRKVVMLRFFVTPKTEATDVENADIDVKGIPQVVKDNIIEELYIEMRDDFKLHEVRQLCEDANYDKDNIIKTYEIYKETDSVVVPIAWMRAALRDQYEKPIKEKKEKKEKKADFEQNTYDYEQLEMDLLKN